MVEQDEEQITEARRQLVSKWTKRVNAAKEHWEPVFKRMREDMAFAKGIQWADQDSLDDERYMANIVKRHLHQRTAALYAKDPKAVAKRRERLVYQLWDGDANSLLTAYQQIQSAMQQGVPQEFLGEVLPEQMALIQDFQQGSEQRKQLDKMAKTVEVLFHYFLGEQRHGFKRQMKQLVRRVLTCAVGYVKLGFQRELERDPGVESRMEDITERLASIRRMQQDAEDGELDPDSAEAEELQLTLTELQDELEIIVREGLVFEFPQSTAIICDPRMRSVEGGFIGADWIAEEYEKTPDEIQELYDIDVKTQATAREAEGSESANTEWAKGKGEGVDGQDPGTVTLWEIYDRKSGLKYTVVEGYPDFMEEPEAPFPATDRFFPIYPLVFNATEDEGDRGAYPLSDVRELRHIQREYNRSKEAVRQHRIANRPLYAGPAGVLEETDQKSLATHPAHGFIALRGIQAGQSVNDIFQPVQKHNIDPNLYETNGLHADFLRVSGDQEANLGGTSKATAFEVNVAEQSRVSSITSNIDDMDEFLSDLSRDAGKVLIHEMSTDQVVKIVGPGAVWPEMSRAELAEELLLEIEAGSSGRPNRAQQIANFERVAPFLLQIPGVSPQWAAEYVLKILDDGLDIQDALISGLPSMVAMNANAQPGTGDPGTDPASQGAAGGAGPQPQAPGGAPPPGSVDAPGM